MATAKECICMINAAGLIKDAKVLEVRSKTVNDLIQRYGLIQEESSLRGIRANAQYLRGTVRAFENTCDISRLGDRLDQYKLGKDKLEQFREESKDLKQFREESKDLKQFQEGPKDLNLAVEAGSKIYNSVFHKFRELIECK